MFDIILNTYIYCACVRIVQGKWCVVCGFVGIYCSVHGFFSLLFCRDRFKLNMYDVQTTHKSFNNTEKNPMLNGMLVDVIVVVVVAIVMRNTPATTKSIDQMNALTLNNFLIRPFSLKERMPSIHLRLFTLNLSLFNRTDNRLHYKKVFFSQWASHMKRILCFPWPKCKNKNKNLAKADKSFVFSLYTSRVPECDQCNLFGLNINWKREVRHLSIYKPMCI